MSAQHTPGPWTVNKGEHCGARIDGPNGRSVAHTIQRDPHPSLGQGITQAEAEANARRIVQCVNAHGELVQLLQEAITRIENADERGLPLTVAVRKWLEPARAALSKAGVQP